MATQELKNVPTIKAYKNPDFLNAPTSRHIRIMCELYEPMKRLREQGVDNYFLVVGSHNVMEEGERTKQIAALEEEVKKGGPEAEAFQLKLQFAKKNQPMDKYYSMAKELSKKLGEWSKERSTKGLSSYHVCTGGGPGVMEAANRGSREAGELAVGFGSTRAEWESLNNYVSEEGAFEFHYFFMQKFWMAYKCMGLVAMPGGVGTFDELFELLVLIDSKKIQHRLPIILLGESFWKKAINWEYLLECGVLTQSQFDHLVFKDSAEEAFQYLVNQVKISDELGENVALVETAKRRRLEKTLSTTSRKGDE